MDLILGRPWHILHSPEIRWETSEVIRWREFCHQHCLKGIPCPRLQSPATQVASTRVESPEPSTTPTIPSDNTFTFSHLAFIQSDLQLGLHKAINLEETNIQRKCQ